MKSLFIFLLVIASSISVFAQEQDGRIIISPVTQTYPVDCCFPKERYQIAPVQEAKVISGRLRDSWFDEVGLSKYVARWDQLDRDMLYKSAVGLPEQRYLKKYSKLPQDKLKKLRQLLMKKGIKP